MLLYIDQSCVAVWASNAQASAATPDSIQVCHRLGGVKVLG